MEVLGAEDAIHFTSTGVIEHARRSYGSPEGVGYEVLLKRIHLDQLIDKAMALSTPKPSKRLRFIRHMQTQHNEGLALAQAVLTDPVVDKWITVTGARFEDFYGKDSDELTRFYNTSGAPPNNRADRYNSALLLRTLFLAKLDFVASHITIELGRAMEDGESMTPTEQNQMNLHKVFLVHGHDDEAKWEVAEFLRKIALDPIILHEQPSGGRTIIEKLEAYSDVAFAVVLFTPDDVGGTKATEVGDLKARARQNVIFELGYFVGKLGRGRVCLLHKATAEIPSDLSGVVYEAIDPAGAWKTKLANELLAAGVDADKSKL